MPLNFADALASIKKKARLQGRPVSQQEVSGVAEGYARESTGRLDVMLAQKRHEATLAQQEEQFDEQMRQDEKDRRAAEKSTRIKSMIGGATAGATVGGVPGAIFGGAAGLILGGGGKCIIITTCTSKDSYNVEISRQFRDKYMSNYQLGGYYALAEAFVPLIKRFTFLRLITKRFLVDRLVDYGEIILGYKDRYKYRSSYLVTKSFLGFCRIIGTRIDVNTYIAPHRD